MSPQLPVSSGGLTVRVLPCMVTGDLSWEFWTKLNQARHYDSAVISGNLQNCIDVFHQSYRENRWKALPRSSFFSCIPKWGHVVPPGCLHLAALTQPLLILLLLRLMCTESWVSHQEIRKVNASHRLKATSLQTSFQAQLSRNLWICHDHLNAKIGHKTKN